MGVVYEAEDLKLHRHVALGFLPKDLSTDTVALRRFEREAQAASALNHPNICTVHDIDTVDGQPFIAMELAASLGASAATVRKGKAILPLQQSAFELALKHRVKIAYGVDDDPDYVSKEFGALVRGGMTPLGAIQAATVNAAELIGMSSDIGTIEAGKFADIVAVNGDPLTDIGVMEKVSFVMKGGVIVRNELTSSEKRN